jgi:hypothetical protein
MWEANFLNEGGIAGLDVLGKKAEGTCGGNFMRRALSAVDGCLPEGSGQKYSGGGYAAWS